MTRKNKANKPGLSPYQHAQCGRSGSVAGPSNFYCEGQNTGNSRNRRDTHKMCTSGGEMEIQGPHDRNGQF